MTDEERKELWAAFAKVLDEQQPATTSWTHNLAETRIVFSAMLDLHERMLEMERKLNEGAGDGK